MLDLLQEIGLFGCEPVSIPMEADLGVNLLVYLWKRLVYLGVNLLVLQEIGKVYELVRLVYCKRPISTIIRDWSVWV